MSNTSSISSLTDSFYSKLSARERLYLIVFGLMSFGVGFYLLFSTWESERASLEGQVKGIRKTIEEVKSNTGRFHEIKARSEAYQKLLKNNKLDLGKLMERYAKSSDLTIEKITSKRRPLDDHIDSRDKESDVVVAYSKEVTLAPTNLKQLTEFLEKLESERSPVRVTAIKFKTLTTDRQELRNIIINVSTYKLEANK